jgi:hypothetical protein
VGWEDAECKISVNLTSEPRGYFRLPFSSSSV